MRNPILILMLQALSLLPAVYFLLLYVEGFISMGIAMILLLLFAVNIYRIINGISLLRFPLWIFLVESFFLYAFYGLGATQAPQTYETLKANQSVTVFNFSKKVQIDEVCYYVGIDENVNFVLESMHNSEWKKFYTYEKDYPFSFRWKCLNVSIDTTKILLRITQNQMMLNEIRFLYKGDTIPYVTKTKSFNDEPEVKIDTSYYGGMFFDEIYFGRTAYEIMHKWDVYENTHPYLGKRLIIPGIQIFGMTPFGWRFMNALFGGLLIFMAYYFALHLFKKETYAFSAAFLMTYSFMHLAQARIGLIDTFGVLFVFISYFYLYLFIVKQKLSRLLISGVFFGLAAAVKWSAVFSALGYVLVAIYLLLSKYPLKREFSGLKLLLYGILSYGVLAFMVYLFSFFDIYAQTGSIQSIIDYNLNMYDYHSTLQATHPYSSQWWEWPLDLKPMGYYKDIKDGFLSSINVFGNPAIFWMGILAMGYLFYVSVRKQTLEAIFILFAFLGLYLPYIFVGRLMFIYHFYYAVPFLILAIVYMFKDGIEKFVWFDKIHIAYLFVVVGLFLAFYPVLSGEIVDQRYVDDWLRWLPTWWF